MLQVEERVYLTESISNLYEFSGGTARDRRVLIEQAGLQRFLPRLDLQGAPRNVAGELVGTLEAFGPLPERPHYHALGALLSYLLILGDLPQERARALARLIVSYSLVTDSAYLAQLRDTYGLVEAPVQMPLPERVVPAPLLMDGEELPFAVPQIGIEALETVINSEDNFLDIDLFMGAFYSAQAVCRVEGPEGTARGTGLLIGPDVLLTNQHVLKSKDYLADAVARFDYRLDAKGVASPGRVIHVRKDFYCASSVEELDYVVVKLEEAPLKDMVAGSDLKGASIADLVLKGKHRGYLVLTNGFIREKDRVNIIQHPGGYPLKAVLTQNYVVADMRPTRVHYIADTMPGSSGSPVFNRNWEVVALHHSGEPYPPDSIANTAKRVWKGRFRVNEGIPMRAILEDFTKKGIMRHLPRE